MTKSIDKVVLPRAATIKPDMKDISDQTAKTNGELYGGVFQPSFLGECL